MPSSSLVEVEVGVGVEVRVEVGVEVEDGVEVGVEVGVWVEVWGVRFGAGLTFPVGWVCGRVVGDLESKANLNSSCSIS